MKVLTVIGARPQFIKASILSESLFNYGINEVIVNTGQHYDFNMSEAFFSEFSIQKPKYNLNVGSGTHNMQTAIIIEKLESIIIDEKPDWVLVYGDTNSTLAAAIGTIKFNIPIAHVEAGLRSYNRKMPEEINRIITDHISTLLFCPSENSKQNLIKEGITDGIYVVGDIMYDIFKKFEHRFSENIQYKNYALLTLHRAENTTKVNLPKRLNQISKLDIKVIFPIHPRTKKCLEQLSINLPKNIIAINPVGWLELMNLTKYADFILTDSGGLQKEAFWHGKICYTLRNETEWIETVNQNTNIIIKESDEINLSKINNCDFNNPYGSGNSSKKIVEIFSEIK